MGSPLRPRLANVFMYSIEESLKSQGKLPATVFLDTLNDTHSAVSFTMEVEKNGMLPWGAASKSRTMC